MSKFESEADYLGVDRGEEDEREQHVNRAVDLLCDYAVCCQGGEGHVEATDDC